MPEDALGYATRLATILWELHWKEQSPNWKPLPDLVGVLTQIDNMTAGLRRVPDNLKTLSARASEGPWYVAKASREDGLAEIEDGREHGLFPITGEWPDIEFVVAACNFVRKSEGR
jgi:hypothetical protein